jgi:hypothetical protein
VSSISKTDYILWRACAKNAWLRIHKSDVYYSTELTEYEQSVMEMGIEVERVARALFPDGASVTGSQTDALQETRSLIASKPRTLFQPVFELEEFLAVIDVLQCEPGRDEWSIYEVKSGTKVKEEHVYDLTFQVLLLRKVGINVRRAGLIVLNSDYVRQDDLNIQRLFKTIDITANVDDISETVSLEMQEARSYLLSETEPKGPCSCIYKARSRHCSTFHYSNPDVPGYGIHDIARIGSSPKKLKELVDAGILALEDIPSDIKLTKGQSNQLRAYRIGETIIDKERSSTSTVTGAYEPASGTCLAISCMMSGLPMTRRTIRGLSRPVAFRTMAPWSNCTKDISPVLPKAFWIEFCSSPTVRAC